MYTHSTINNELSYTPRNNTINYSYNTISIPHHKTSQPFIKKMHSLRKYSQESANSFFHNFHKTQLRNYYNLITKPKLQLEHKLPSSPSPIPTNPSSQILPLSLKAPHYYELKPFFLIKPKKPFLTFSNTPCKHRHRKQIVNTSHNSLTLKYDDISNTKMTTTLSTETNVQQSQYQIPRRTFCTALANCYNGLSKNETNTIDGFNMKVNALRSLYMTKITLETALKDKKEDIECQVEEMERKKYLYVKEYKLFRKYYESLVLLVRKLERESNYETKKRDDLYFYKTELEMKNAELRNKIEKKKNELNKYENYKAFLLMVKYHVRNIYELPYEIYVKYGYNRNNNNIKTKPLTQRKTNILIRKNTFNTNNNTSTNTLNNSIGKAPIIRQSTKMNINTSCLNTSGTVHFQGTKTLLRKTTTRRNIPAPSSSGINATFRFKPNLSDYNLPIFDTPNDFLSELASLESNTFLKFASYNMHQHNNIQLKCFQSKALSKYNSIHLENENNIEHTFTYLNEIKNVHSQLQHNLQSIQYDLSYGTSNNKIMDIINEKMGMFLNKIRNDIEKVLNRNEYGVIVRKGSEEKEMITLNGKKVNRALFMMRMIEKVLMYYINENKQHKGGELYGSVSKRINDVKRRKRNEEMKMIRKQNEIEIRNKIIMKAKKIIIKQGRNVYNKGIEELNKNNNKNVSLSKKRNNKKDINEHESEMYQFITY